MGSWIGRRPAAIPPGPLLREACIPSSKLAALPNAQPSDYERLRDCTPIYCFTVQMPAGPWCRSWERRPDPHVDDRNPAPCRPRYLPGPASACQLESGVGLEPWHSSVGLGAAVLPLGQMPAVPTSGQVGVHVTGLVDCQLNSKGSVLCGSVYVVIEEKNKTLDQVHMVIAGRDSV